MSYIRCLSNPEGLYIWSDGKMICICHSLQDSIFSNFPAQKMSPFFAISHDLFHEAVRKWWDAFGDDIVYKDVIIKEEHIHLDDGSIVPLIKSTKAALEQLNLPHRQTRFVIRLEYKGQFIRMWFVTWQYIVNNVILRKRPKKQIFSWFVNFLRKSKK